MENNQSSGNQDGRTHLPTETKRIGAEEEAGLPDVDILILLDPRSNSYSDELGTGTKSVKIPHAFMPILPGMFQHPIEKKEPWWLLQ